MRESTGRAPKVSQRTRMETINSPSFDRGQSQSRSISRGQLSEKSGGSFTSLRGTSQRGKSGAQSKSARQTGNSTTGGISIFMESLSRPHLLSRLL